MPIYRIVTGIHISGNLPGEIKMAITPWICTQKIQNLCSNLCSECGLSNTIRPRLRIPYYSKVIVETVTEGHFSTHFESDSGSLITSHKRIFYPEFDF